MEISRIERDVQFQPRLQLTRLEIRFFFLFSYLFYYMCMYVYPITKMICIIAQMSFACDTLRVSDLYQQNPKFHRVNQIRNLARCIAIHVENSVPSIFSRGSFLCNKRCRRLWSVKSVSHQYDHANACVCLGVELILVEKRH